MTSKTNIVITGATQGLGLELCREAVRRGYNVIALDIGPGREIEGLISPNLKFFVCDISDPSAVEETAKNCGEKTLDLIINNAGIYREHDHLPLEAETFNFDDMLLQYRVNAMGVINVCRAFIGLMKDSTHKTVINISSEAGSISGCYRKCEYGYCMSKAAQNMATKIMQNEYRDAGFKFYCLHPGWMRTPQGMATATAEEEPQQRPEDSAKFIIDLFENKNLSGMYYDVDSSELKW